MVSEFIYRQPVEIRFGRGKLAELPEILAGRGLHRGLIVCGRHFAPEAQRLVEQNCGVVAVFSDLQLEPQLSGVEEAVRLAREYQVDCVIGIGGGSAMDTAKFVAAVAPTDADALTYFNGDRPLPERGLPIIAVPTTSGTGSEVTQVSVISHGATKRTINNPVFMPAVALVDPDLSDTVPARVVMCTGLDALAHALEGYWSRNHQPISDLMAVEAVRLVLGNLENAWRDPDDRIAHERMAYAALLGGLSFALPKTAGCHACSYPICEHFHVSHGEACAFTLDSFVRVNADERLEELCRRAGIGDTQQLADWINRMKALSGLPMKLSQLGEADTAQLARECAAHPLMNNNPVPMDEGALRNLFEALR